MAVSISTPPTFSGTDENRYQQIWSYLYQLAGQLNDALNNLTVDSFSDEQQAAIRKASGINTDGSVTTVAGSTQELQMMIETLQAKVTRLSATMGTFKQASTDDIDDLEERMGDLSFAYSAYLGVAGYYKPGGTALVPIAPPVSYLANDEIATASVPADTETTICNALSLTKGVWMVTASVTGTFTSSATGVGMIRIGDYGRAAIPYSGGSGYGCVSCVISLSGSESMAPMITTPAACTVTEVRFHAARLSTFKEGDY